MSQENLETVRRLLEHWDAGDWGGGRDLYGADCEAILSTSWFPDAGVYSIGPEALRAWTDFTAAWEDLGMGVDKIIETADHVVALTRIHGRGRASGAEVDAETGILFTVRGGKIVRFELTDRRKALEAAGLRE